MHETFFALKRAYLAARRKLDEYLACHDITIAQLDILVHLHEAGGTEQRDLQHQIGITAATLTRLIDGLAQRHLVERRPHPEDARVKEVFLTEAGAAILHELKEMKLNFFADRCLKGFTTTEIALMTEWLNRLAENIENAPLDVVQ